MRAHHRLMALWLVSPAATLAFGCAKAKIDTTQAAPTHSIVKPPVLLVYDFAVTPEDAVVDSIGHYPKTRTKPSQKRSSSADAFFSMDSLSCRSPEPSLNSSVYSVQTGLTAHSQYIFQSPLRGESTTSIYLGGLS